MMIKETLSVVCDSNCSDTVVDGNPLVCLGVAAVVGRREQTKSHGVGVSGWANGRRDGGGGAKEGSRKHGDLVFFFYFSWCC